MSGEDSPYVAKNVDFSQFRDPSTPKHEYKAFDGLISFLKINLHRSQEVNLGNKVAALLQKGEPDNQSEEEKKSEGEEVAEPAVVGIE